VRLSSLLDFLELVRRPGCPYVDDQAILDDDEERPRKRRKTTSSQRRKKTSKANRSQFCHVFSANDDEEEEAVLKPLAKSEASGERKKGLTAPKLCLHKTSGVATPVKKPRAAKTKAAPKGVPTLQQFMARPQ